MVFHVYLWFGKPFHKMAKTRWKMGFLETVSEETKKHVNFSPCSLDLLGVVTSDRLKVTFPILKILVRVAGAQIGVKKSPKMAKNDTFWTMTLNPSI